MITRVRNTAFCCLVVLIGFGLSCSRNQEAGGSASTKDVVHMTACWEAMVDYDGSGARLLPVVSSLLAQPPEEYRCSGYRLRSEREPGRLMHSIDPDLILGEASFRISTGKLQQAGPLAAVRAIGSDASLSATDREHALRSAEQLFAGVMDSHRDIDEEFYPLILTLRGIALQTLLETIEVLPDRAELEARAVKLKGIVQDRASQPYTGDPF